MKTLLPVNRRMYIISIVALMVSAVIIIVVLTLLSPALIQTGPGFNRKVLNLSLQVTGSRKLRQPARSVCSISSNEIYFETEQPGILFKTDFYLCHIDTIDLRLKPDHVVTSLFETHIDSDNVFIGAGNLPAIIKTHFINNSQHYYHMPTTFTQSLMISKSIFIFRAYKKFSNQWDQIFIRGNLENGELKEEQHISERNGDAGFSTDGLLYFDSLTNRIVYVYHYRSSFICMDTALHLLYKASTIDTSGFPDVKAETVISGRDTIITNTTPLRDINVMSCVANGKLFNVSKRKADNESVSRFENNSVVDVYDIKGGLYEGSFYIPFYKGEKMQDFKVLGQRIIVLYTTHIVTYKLSPLL